MFLNNCDGFLNQNEDEISDNGIVSLNIGNSYIWSVDIQGVSGFLHDYYTDTIVTTVKINGKKYYKYKGGNCLREEDEKVYFYYIDNTELLLYDFSVNVGDTTTYGSYVFIVESIDYETVLDDTAVQKVITVSDEKFNNEVVNIRRYATKFGLVGLVEYGKMDTVYSYIVCANIKGKQYGSF